ncbi:hypothetical protein Hanom_Chr08g00717381 [Helianthus anomalus]
MLNIGCANSILSQQVKGKGKARLFVDRSDTVESLNKECKGRKRYTTSSETVKKLLTVVQNVKLRKKVSRNPSKVSGLGMDPEFFNFSRRAEYRLVLFFT